MSLRVDDLRVYYRTLAGDVRALDGVSFEIADGEIMGVAGDRELERATLAGPDGVETEVSLSALFVFIGQSPRTDWLEGFALRDRAGFVLSGREAFPNGKPPPGWGSDREPFLLESSVPGVFVAVTILPRWLADIGQIFPVRHLADAILVAYNPHTTGLGFAGLDLLIVAAWGAAGFLVALRTFSWLPLGR